MTDITPEILSRLDALAVKLHVTGSHLWEVLIKHAYIDGIKDVIGIIATFIIFLMSIYFYKFFMKKHNKVEEDIIAENIWRQLVLY